MAIRCITLNTYCWALGPAGSFYQAPHRRRRAAEAGRWLKSAGADFVFLQEVFRKEDAEALRKQSGFAHAYFPGQGSGLGILSRFPLEGVGFVPFRWQGSLFKEVVRLSARMKRGTGAAWAKLPDGSRIRLFVTHLLARYHEVAGFDQPADCLTPERKANLLELGASIENWTSEGEPWILAGDFNMNQRSEEYAFFSRFGGFGDALRECDPEWEKLETYSAENPWVKSQGNPGEGLLDYFFYSKGSLSPKTARILAETDSFTDHRAVEAVFETADAPTEKFRTPPLGSDERREMARYFRQLRLPLVSCLAPCTGWTQRRDIQRFLQLQ